MNKQSIFFCLCLTALLIFFPMIANSTPNIPQSYAQEITTPAAPDKTCRQYRDIIVNGFNDYELNQVNSLYYYTLVTLTNDPAIRQQLGTDEQVFKSIIKSMAILNMNLVLHFKHVGFYTPVTVSFPCVPNNVPIPDGFAKITDPETKIDKIAELLSSHIGVSIAHAQPITSFDMGDFRFETDRSLTEPGDLDDGVSFEMNSSGTFELPSWLNDPAFNLKHDFCIKDFETPSLSTFAGIPYTFELNVQTIPDDTLGMDLRTAKWSVMSCGADILGIKGLEFSVWGRSEETPFNTIPNHDVFVGFGIRLGSFLEMF